MPLPTKKKERRHRTRSDSHRSLRRTTLNAHLLCPPPPPPAGCRGGGFALPAPPPPFPSPPPAAAATSCFLSISPSRGKPNRFLRAISSFLRVVCPSVRRFVGVCCGMRVVVNVGRHKRRKWEGGRVGWDGESLNSEFKVDGEGVVPYVVTSPR